MDTPTKRVVPKELKYILDKDREITGKFLDVTKDSTLFRSLKNHSRMLEITCHGIAWISVCLASVWIINEPKLFQLQANLFLALILDIVIVALLKAYTSRRRPTPAKSGDFGPDKFSFPSGHASRAALVLYIFLFIHPLPIFCVPPLFAWVTSVSVSRVVAERHYILDVVCGIGIGLMEGMLYHLLWLGPESSTYLISFISDETNFGGEYHV